MLGFGTGVWREGVLRWVRGWIQGNPLEVKSPDKGGRGEHVVIFVTRCRWETLKEV